jgi:GNAT superfamily N-acetyltransferase
VHVNGRVSGTASGKPEQERHRVEVSSFTLTTASTREHARALLCAASPPNGSFTQRSNFSVESIDRALRLGLRKPQWVWAAHDSAGAQLGVVAGWGSEARETPWMLDLLDLPLGNAAAAGALIERAIAESSEPGRESMEILHFLPPDSSATEPEVAAFVSLLSASGFQLLVRRHRYRLEVEAGTVPAPPTDLRFESLAGAADPRLPAIFADILVDSLDAHDRAALSKRDLATVARETAEEYLELDPVNSMFLAFDPRGECIGLVIGGLRGSPENGTVSFIGVSHRHRGNGYAGQLLGWITAQMIDAGARTIIGETDEDNVPMAAAFAAAGYPTTESRIDFVRYL